MSAPGKLTVWLALTVVFALMFAGAALAGQGVVGPYAVVQPEGTDAGRVRFSLLDLDRAILTHRSLAVPNAVSARFEPLAVYVLQVVRYDGVADWTLSRLDPLTGALTTQALLTTESSSRLTAPDFLRTYDQGWLVYAPWSGETYYLKQFESQD